MDVLGSIVGFVIALVLFAIKNWKDLKDAKKAISELMTIVEEAKADNKITDKEKADIADQSLKTLGSVIPVLTSIWKFNWKKKREVKDVVAK